MAAAIPPSADIVSVVKGLERVTLLRMSEVIAEAGSIDSRRIAALSGPNLAGEVARGLPASAVVAADDLALAERVQHRIGTRRFRLYVNRDLLGVEMAREKRVSRQPAPTALAGDMANRPHHPRPRRDDPLGIAAGANC
jgi:glycerol-3-phosphate dehydrogenase